jgi:ADP-ribose pyrophosphatase YjhB (NUDIX family)
MSADENGQPYCNNCQITIYRNVAVCANVLPVKGDKVLLAVRALDPFKGTFDTVGGFVDPGETVEQCALREAKEETGLDMEIVELLGNYPDKYGDGTDLLSFAFIAKITSTLPPQAADDVAELKWFPITNPPLKLIGFPSAQRVLMDLKQWYLNQA